MTPCPHCGKLMGKRVLSRLAPAVPAHFGPFRRDAVETSQRGWCACCDARPIPGYRKGIRRYTCASKCCTQRWAYLTRLDHEAAAKEAA